MNGDGYTPLLSVACILMQLISKEGNVLFNDALKNILIMVILHQTIWLRNIKMKVKTHCYHKGYFL